MAHADESARSSVGVPKFAVDIVERVVTSALGGYVGMLGLDVTSIVDSNQVTVIAVGVATAIISLVKGLIAKFVGNKQSASMTRDV